MSMSTVTTKDQATISEEIHKLLNINIDDKILFLNLIPEKKQIVLQALPQSNTIDRLFGSLKTNVSYADMKTVRKKVGSQLHRLLAHYIK